MIPAAVGGPYPCSLRCARIGIPQRRTPNRKADLARGSGIVGGIRIAETSLPSLTRGWGIGFWGSCCSADARGVVWGGAVPLLFLYREVPGCWARGFCSGL